MPIHGWSITPNKPIALLLARRELSSLVHESVLLEGINFTLPEIQTLIDGITVGGHTLSDQQVAINQSAAWKSLFERIKHGDFSLSAETALDLHRLAGKEEALLWGQFRTGDVTIAGTDYLPPPADELPHRFEQMVSDAQRIEDPIDRACFVFLTMARAQFFFDVNKRTGRLMMNGMLLDEGYPVINVPASRQLEFNTLMLEFYPTGDVEPMTRFLASCIDPRTVRIINETQLECLLDEASKPSQGPSM